jgi:hypothetical protein
MTQRIDTLTQDKDIIVPQFLPERLISVLSI